MIVVFIFKLAGAGCILLSGIKFGVEYKQKLQKRTDFFESVKSGLTHLEGQIVMSEEMLEMGMRECGKRFFVNSNGRDLFSSFADKLSEGEASVEECWNDSVENSTCDIDVTDDEKIMLKSLGNTLGTADVEHHSSHILNVVNKISEIKDSADKKLKRDGSLILKLGVAIAAILILMLW